MAVLNHCRQVAPGVGQLLPCRIGKFNTTAFLPPSRPYRGVCLFMHGLAVGATTLYPTPLQPQPYITRTGCTVTAGSATILDPNAVKSDEGQSLSPAVVTSTLSIPVTAVIQSGSVVPGVSYQVQNTAAGLPVANSSSVIIGGNNFFPFYGVNGGLALQQLMQAAGWVVLAIPYPEDNYVSTGAYGVWTDIKNDTGNGARYLTTFTPWRDHILDFVQRTFGYWPLIALGGSWGGLHALMWASLHPEDLVAYMACIPATEVSHANDTFTGLANFGPATISGNPGLPNGTAGLDMGPHCLDACSLPGCICYHTLDSAVGWGDTTNAAGNNVDVNTFTGAGVLHVTDTGKIKAAGPLLDVDTAAGIAVMTYTGITGTTPGTATGCTTLKGSGVPTLGGKVVQSYANQIINNANVAHPGLCTRIQDSAYGTIPSSGPSGAPGSGQAHIVSITDAEALDQWRAAVVDIHYPAIY